MDSPRIVRTRDEVDALPDETVIRECGDNGMVYERGSGRWFSPGWDTDMDTMIDLPAQILWHPEQDTTDA